MPAINREKFWSSTKDLIPEQTKEVVWDKLTSSSAPLTQDFFWTATENLIDEETKRIIWQKLKEPNDNIEEAPSFTLDTYKVIYALGGLILLWGIFFITKQGLQTGNYRGGYLFTFSALYTAFFGIGSYLMYKKTRFASFAQVLGFISFSMLPIAIYGLQDFFDIWPSTGQHNLDVIFYEHHWRNVVIFIAPLLYGTLLMRVLRCSFLLLPMSLLMRMLLGDMVVLVTNTRLTWGINHHAWLWFTTGMIVLLISYMLDINNKTDFGFWGYLFSISTIWLALTNIVFDKFPSHHQGALFAYALSNVAFVLLGLFLRRKSFIGAGFFGISLYSLQLVHYFYTQPHFPLIMIIIAMVIITLTYLWQTHFKGKITKMICQMTLPSGLAQYRPVKRQNLF
ncbi:MAG: hypothetical protein RLZ12_603 [Bacillota bacterium]|jgi:hypothetical protein